MADLEVIGLGCQVSPVVCKSGGYEERCKGCQGDGTRVVVIPEPFESERMIDHIYITPERFGEHPNG